MSDAAANAPMFIEAFHDACESLHGRTRTMWSRMRP